MKYRCPCCNYKTMDNEEPLYHDICLVCYWENDPIQNNNENYFGGANKMSLSQARQNFYKIGAVSEDVAHLVRIPLIDEL